MKSLDDMSDAGAHAILWFAMAANEPMSERPAPAGLSVLLVSPAA